MAKDSGQQELPFFQSLAAGGIGAVKIDKWKAAKYGFGLIVIFSIIIALNSNSWYSWTIDEDPNVGINFGLDELEIVQPYTEDDIEQNMKIDYSKCYDEMEVIFNCEEMSSSGVVIKLSLWLSLLSLSALVIISTCRGFGKLDNDFFNEHFENIEKIGFALSSLIIIVGLLLYALMVPSPSSYIESDLESSSLGLTWWMMFFLSSAFTAIVFNKQVMLLIETVTEKLNKDHKKSS